MRLAEYTDYSLRVLMYCARHADRRVTVAELAERQGLPRNQVMKIVADFARHGLLQTARGRGGGVRLLRPADQIRVGDVVRLSETDFRMAECFDDAGGSYNGTPFSWDVLLGTNIVENSSYTAILEDGSGNAIFSAFVTDGGAGDFANQAGAAITPDITVGPDGTFTPAGFAVLDKNLNTTWLNFDTALLNDGTIAGGTPGVNQKIPTPGALALLGVSGLAATRRRR